MCAGDEEVPNDAEQIGMLGIRSFSCDYAPSAIAWDSVERWAITGKKDT